MINVPVEAQGRMINRNESKYLFLFFLLFFLFIDLTTSRLIHNRELVNRSTSQKLKWWVSRFNAFADLYISRLGIGIKKHSWNRLNLGKLESWSPSQLYTWTVKYMAHMLVWNSIQTLIEETHIWLLSFSRFVV